MKTGSLFSGSGMLDAAVHHVLGAEPVWFVENDPDAAAVLAWHWPGVPNYGDVTTMDWSTVEPVDVLTAGFPCENVSSAGKRAGMLPGNRSGLWSYAAYATAQLQPRLVVIENVRGLLSADAHCDLEPCPWCMGKVKGRPLRALGAVLGDLASIGYDARWCGLRASAVGAAHGRFRVFIIAWPTAHAEGVGPVREGHPRGRGHGPADHGRFAADPAGSGWGPIQPEHVTADSSETARPGETELGRCAGATTDTSSGELRQQPGRCSGPSGSGSGIAGNDGAQRSPVADTDRERWEGSRPAGSPPGNGRHVADPDRPIAADPTSNGRREGRPEPAGQFRGPDVAFGGDVVSADTPSGSDADQSRSGEPEKQSLRPVVGPSDRSGEGDPAEGIRQLGTDAEIVAWGIYEPAIRRWELILGRPTPPPTLTGKRGGQQLAPAFVEWLMGWPQGWVTDVPGLSRNAQLKICGKGVVPHQAITAITHLLGRDVA